MTTPLTRRRPHGVTSPSFYLFRHRTASGVAGFNKARVDYRARLAGRAAIIATNAIFYRYIVNDYRLLAGRAPSSRHDIRWLAPVIRS